MTGENTRFVTGGNNEVLAYRELTREELLAAVRTYLTRLGKKPKKGTLVTIISVVGRAE